MSNPSLRSDNGKNPTPEDQRMLLMRTPNPPQQQQFDNSQPLLPSIEQRPPDQFQPYGEHQVGYRSGGQFQFTPQYNDQFGSSSRELQQNQSNFEQSFPTMDQPRNQFDERHHHDSIDEKFIYDFDENFTCQQIEELKDDENFRILRIKACKYIKALMSKIQEKSFKQAFSKTSHLFVIIVETIDGLLNETFFLSIFNDNRPLVIQITEMSKKTTFYYKEFKSSEFTKLSRMNSISKDEFIEHFGSESGCNFGTFLRAINSGVLGTLNVKLTEAKLSNGNLTQKVLRFATKFNILCLRVLALFKSNLGAEISSLFEVLKNDVKESLMALLDLSFTITEEKYNFEILMAIIKNDNVGALKLVLLNKRFKTNNFVEHIKAAYELKHFECVKELIEADSSFPEIFNFEDFINCPLVADRLIAIIKQKTFLHDAIRTGNIARVKRFLKKHPQLKFAYSTRNKSAISVALQTKQFKIYYLLRSRGFAAGIDQHFYELMSKLSDEEKAMIKESNKGYFKAQENSHLFHILARTKLSLDHVDSEHWFKIIRLMYDTLNEIPGIISALLFLENCDKFQIIYNFFELHIMDMDPTAGQFTKARYCPSSGYIYVAAKNHETEFFEIVGALAHELMHFVVQLVYDNDCKPYKSMDHKSKASFEIITQELHQLSIDPQHETHPIISGVFHYPMTHWHSELIVRVPHLLALLKDDVTRELSDIEQGYGSKLFDYYMNKTLCDIEAEKDFFKPKSAIQEINRSIGLMAIVGQCQLKVSESVIRENQHLTVISVTTYRNIVSSDVPIVTMSLIFQLLYNKYGNRVDKEVILVDKESLKNLHLSAKILKACKSKANPLLIVKTEKRSSFDTLLKETFGKIVNGKLQMNSLLMNEKLLIVADVDGSDSLNEALANDQNLNLFKLTHKFKDLNPDSQSFLLQKEVMFQGSPVKLQELLSSSMNDFPLQTLLSDIRIENIMQDKSFFLLQGAYIERKFAVQRAKDWSQTIMSQDELVKEAKVKKIVIIAADTGMGKSTTLKEIAGILKHNQPTYWVSILDLKQHVDKFRDVKKIPKDKQTLFQILIMCIEKDFDQKVFLACYRAGMVILLLDGFDEVSPTYKELILEAVKSFDTGVGNQLWITTRLHLKEDLEQQLKQTAYLLLPLTTEDQIKVLTEYWRFKRVDDNAQVTQLEQSTLEKLARNLISEISKDLLKEKTSKQHNSSNDSDVLGIPLQVRMIAEIHDGKTTQVIQIRNLFSIYEEFSRKIGENWMHNRGLQAKLDQEEISFNSSTPFLKVHQQIALSYFFDSDFVNLEIENEGWTKEMIARVGMVHLPSAGKIHFVHETFAEFFVAQYIIDKLKMTKIKSEDKTLMAELLPNVLTDENFWKIRTFLDKGLEIQKSRGLLTTICAEIAHNLIEEEKCVEILHKTFAEENQFLFRFIFDCLEHGSEVDVENLRFDTIESLNLFRLVESIIQNMKEQIKIKSRMAIMDDEYRSYMEEKGHKFMSQWCVKMNLEGFEKNKYEEMSSILQEVVTNERLKNQLNKHRSKDRKNILSLMARNSADNLSETFWEALRQVFDSNKLKVFLYEEDENGLTALHLALRWNDDKFIINLFRIIRSVLNLGEQRVFLKKCDSIGRNILCYAAQNTKKVFATLWSCFEESSFEYDFKLLLKQKDTHGQNVLHTMINGNYEESFEEFSLVLQEVFDNEELKFYLNIKEDKFRRNVFCLLAGSSYKTFFQSFWRFSQRIFNRNELKALLIDSDNKKLNVLLIALINNDKYFVKTLITIIQETLDKEEMVCLFQKCNYYSSCILHCIACNKRNFHILTTLWTCFKEFSLEDVFKSLMNHTDSDGKNMLCFLIARQNITTTQELITILSDVFTREELKLYLIGTKTCYRQNIISTIAQFSNKKFFEMFWMYLKEALNSNELKCLLFEKDMKGSSPFHLAIFCNNDCIITALFDIIQKLLSFEEQKKFVQMRTDDGYNVIHLAAYKNENGSTLITLWNCFKQFSMKHVFRSMIHKDDNFKLLVDINNQKPSEEWKTIMQDIF